MGERILAKIETRVQGPGILVPEASQGLLGAVVGLAVGLAITLSAQPSRAQYDPRAPVAIAVRVDTSPNIDGDVLGEALWTDVPAATGFTQVAPDEGAPASERTEVRIVFTQETLYVGVVCFDREPGRIVISESRRDASLSDTDSFQMILDTFHDLQNGFVFGTNPTGLEYDGQVTREGEGGSGPGSPSGFNLNWDGSWEVRAIVGEFGWSAEFAIPFRTLRYTNLPGQTWGLNFQRNIRWRNETSYWSPVGRQFNVYRLSAAGVLEGIETPPQRNLKVVPYVLTEGARDYADGDSWQDDADIGGDLKYSVTPSLTLDLTVNTDFAQVEADEQQINLDRFNLFFPEKRPFFLENAGFFTVGNAGDTELFFSRRIGIGPSGQIVPIMAGGRVSGKSFGMNVGVLNMQTRAVDDVAPANNFTVARLARELPNRSSIGAIFANRSATDGPGAGSDHNQTLGVDGRWGIGRYGMVSGFASRTWTPGAMESEHAVQVEARHESPAWDFSASYADVGEDFNPEVGFARRTGFRNPRGLVFHRWRPEDLLGLMEVRPHVSYRGFWKPDGFHESSFLHMDSHWEWRSGAEIHTGVNVTHEGLREPFEISSGVIVPAGGYDHAELQLSANTNEGAALSASARAVIGGFFGGDRVTVTPAVRARIGQVFDIDVRWQHNDVNLPGGDFVTNLVRGRVSYSFTPRLFVQALLQYNDTIDNWSTNLRFGWLQTANAGLYVVYNENVGVGEALDSGVRDRSVVLKLSRVLDLLN